MLTPQEISERELVKAVFGGYDIAVVDDFLETISADYAALYKENAILKSKIKVLVEKVEEYRSTEDSMRMALLTAQKMGDELLKEAKDKSEAMVKTAQEESDATLKAAKEEAAKIVADLQAKVSEEESRLAVAKEATAAFVRQSRDLASKIDSFLQAVPGLEMKKAPVKEEPAAVEEAPAEPDREEEIMDTAAAIDEAVTKITEEPEAEPSLTAEEIVAEEKPKFDDESEYTTRPKFDFDNLRFGTNFTEE
ncbi:MAG: DivIVA domain-containing protein [Oscillospiraceae bacterium]|nr:DivIVA domain-containing protein [Oscillospiraceae bacterium]